MPIFISMFKSIVFISYYFGLTYGFLGITIRPAQSVSVKGQLVCRSEPRDNVLIEMYDEDSITADDFMGRGISDSHGNFSFGGTTYEFFEIAPKIHIYHNCINEKSPCVQKLTLYIPKYYISYSETPSEYLVYDTGIVELFNRSLNCSYN